MSLVKTGTISSNDQKVDKKFGKNHDGINWNSKKAKKDDGKKPDKS